MMKNRKAISAAVALAFMLYGWVVTLTEFEFGQLINEKEFNVESN